MNASYVWYGGCDKQLQIGDNEISIEFKVEKETASDIIFKFSLGKIESEETLPGKLIFTDIHLAEVTE